MIRTQSSANAVPRTSLAWPILLALYGLALAMRIAAVLQPPLGDGDWWTYSRVAGNILAGCGVSLSEAGACVPHFGGNGLPGYPAFIALAWLLLGPTKIAVLWAQSIVSALAVPWLARGVTRMAGRNAGLVCGLVAALSPLQAFMARRALTEELTIGVVNWLLAELAVSIAERRLRVLPIAAAISVGLFLRLDFVVFLVPVAIIGLWLHGFAGALRRGCLLAALLCLPLGAWSLRNVAVGIDPLPPARSWMLPNGSQGPQGYLAWLKQWVTNSDQRAAATFFWNDDYNVIELLPGSFRRAEDEAPANALLAALRGHAGEPFPPEIDASFADLARHDAASRSLGETLALRAAQAWGCWEGWTELLPSTLYPPGQVPPTGGLRARIAERLAGGAGAWLDLLTRLYRCLLGVAFLGALASLGRGIARRRIPWLAEERRRILILAGLALVLTKTALGVAGLFLDIRYTTTAVPWMELVVALSIVEFVAHRQAGAVAGQGPATTTRKLASVTRG